MPNPAGCPVLEEESRLPKGVSDKASGRVAPLDKVNLHCQRAAPCQRPCLARWNDV